MSRNPYVTTLRPPAGGFSIYEWWFALLLMLMMGIPALAVNQRRRRVPLLAGAVLLAAVAISCGGGGGGGGSTGSGPATPKGTYTLTVTGTSGRLQHSTTMTLTAGGAYVAVLAMYANIKASPRAG